MSRSLLFPSFNFPFDFESDDRHSFVDYGTCGMVDVDYTSKGLHVYKQKEHEAPGRPYLAARQPTIPLGQPAYTNTVPRVKSNTKLKDVCNNNLEYQTDNSFSNCLSYCPLPSNTTSSDCVLFYSSDGPNGHQLHMGSLSIGDNPQDRMKEEEEEEEEELSVDWNHMDTFDITGRIKQICSNFYNGESLIAVRTDEQCTVIAKPLEAKRPVNQQTFTPLSSDERLMSIAVNPYIPGEVVAVTDTGNILFWNVECGKKQLDTSICESSSQWFQCEFAIHPRSILVANSTSAHLIDFRSYKRSSASSRPLMTLPSPQLSCMDRFSAVQSNESNPYQYILATNQSVLLMDERFLQQPILKWHHHLQGTADLLAIKNGTLAGSEDTVILIGSKSYHQVHCFQYCDGQTSADTHPSFFPEDVKFVLPPQSTTLPWKISSYSEWPYMLDTHLTTDSDLVKDRLALPLTGLCAIPHSDTTTVKKGFTVIQSSIAGDLFYQSFLTEIPETTDTGEDRCKDRTCSLTPGSDKPKMNKQSVSQCMQWIRSIKTGENAVEKHKYFFGEFAELLESKAPCHKDCEFCDPMPHEQFSDQEEQEEMSDDYACKACGYNVDILNKFLSVRDSQTVVTCSALDLTPESEDIFPFEDLNIENSKDPLSTVLSHNWFSEKPQPLNLEGDRGTPVIKHEVIEETASPALKQPAPQIQPRGAMVNKQNNDFEQSLWVDGIEMLTPQIHVTPLRVVQRKETKSSVKRPRVMGF